jgi:SAM-dependent methyltransferase
VIKSLPLHVINFLKTLTLYCFHEILGKDKPEALLTLVGDRAIEWSWVVAHLPKERSRVMDLGCVDSPLTGIAARLGHTVTAVDLRDIEYEMPGINFIKKDIMELDFGQILFDLILNCSTIEHIGLKNRYGSSESADGDLVTMQKLSKLLLPGGRMILTIPVGQDAEYAPYHRIYGHNRLATLLNKFFILQEEFWAKDQRLRWRRCSKEEALSTHGSESYYAIGLFLLARKERPTCVSI